MGIYLNSIEPYEKYSIMARELYFVDKSEIMKDIFPLIDGFSKYLCITRPRRFGKTVMANLVAAFFGNAYDSSDIFDKLKISQHPDYKKHLNAYDVIYIDFSRVSKKCQSYEQYISRIEDTLADELNEAYPGIKLRTDDGLWDILCKVYMKNGKKRFIFVLDEWDAVFHMDFMTEKDKNDYLLFLKTLLKDQVYVGLAYMTGVLPIAKYSDGSALNMFLEYQMMTIPRFSEYFGFTDSEIDDLFKRYLQSCSSPNITREDLKDWYDGYHSASGVRLYNPRSIVSALSTNKIGSYWTESGRYDSIYYYIKHNINDVRDDVARMVAGERIRARYLSYAAAAMELRTREEIFSAMLVYGMLTADDGEVFIPNKELMKKFEETVRTYDDLGYIYRLARESDRMLAATLEGDTETMAHILGYAHNTESPILIYNHETELAAIVNLVYLSARDLYRVEREDKAGKGFVDFIFYPQRMSDDCIILELKSDASPQEAIEQIKEKQYDLKFKGRPGDACKYTGRILAVGISYDRKTKEHSCAVEVL